MSTVKWNIRKQNNLKITSTFTSFLHYKCKKLYLKTVQLLFESWFRESKKFVAACNEVKQ